MKNLFINNNNFNFYKETNVVLYFLIFFVSSQFYGPLLINLSHIFALIIFIILIKKDAISIKIKLDFLIFITFVFLIYIIFNTFILVDDVSIVFKSIFYFRFVLSAYIVFYLVSFIKDKHYILSFILLAISILLSFDVIYQSITGYDIFGFRAGLCSFINGEQNLDPKNCERFSGFFGDEYIAGSFLSTYGIFSIYFYFLNSKKNFLNNLFIIFSIIIILYATIISGERNAFLNLLLITSFNIIFNKNIRKYILIIIIMIILILFISIKNNSMVKYRYLDWPLSAISSNKGNLSQKILQTQWGAHYITGYEIFTQNKIFGSGFKSFRSVCNKDFYNVNQINEKYNLELKVSGCSTHPHNIFIELLSELGLTGLFLFLVFITTILFLPLFKNYKRIKDFKSIVLILSIILTFLFPFRPTGSFSSTSYITNLFFFIGFYFYFVTNNRKTCLKKK